MMIMPSSVRLYIALNTDLKPIGAQEAGTQPLESYQCSHCQAALYLHREGLEYYFMHADCTIEQTCSYCKALLNPLYRDFELAKWGACLPPLIPVAQWYCTLCQHYYEGAKRCPCCQNDIYSTEAGLIDTPLATKPDWSSQY